MHTAVFWVAPYTGAWIEIPLPLLQHRLALVAPYTGAWIEILGYPHRIECGH